jgi:hypothetical protein
LPSEIGAFAANCVLKTNRKKKKAYRGLTAILFVLFLAAAQSGWRLDQMEDREKTKTAYA